MMPQKRNLFLLEHIKGRSAAALGAFVNSVTAMSGTPFSNSIAAGTEAVAPVWNALKSITESIVLARLVLSGASPQREAMHRAAVKGYTTATELANRLVIESGMSFRTAHYTVGALIREAIDNGGEELQSVAARGQRLKNASALFEGLDPTSVSQASIYGGGPGPLSLDACLRSLHSSWLVFMRLKREQERKLHLAEAALDEAARRLCSSVEANNSFDHSPLS
jgi:argininosuccinate lyase